jgi:hypothetical protein
MWNKIIKTSFYIFGYLLKPCVKIWIILLNFNQIMAIENFKKHFILAHLFFNIAF